MSLPFNGERLREARRFRQLTIPQLAERIGVSKQMISKYEHDDAQPSAKNYQKMVLALKFPLSFFQEYNKFTYDNIGTFYRSRLTSTQTEKRPSEFLKKSLAILADLLEDYVDFPELKEMDYLTEDPAEAAKSLREFWRLGDKPINNMLHLLETHGFYIASIGSLSEKVDAFGSQIKINNRNYYCILVDQDNNSFYRQQFSLAHELGHWILHSEKIDPQELDPQEYREMEKQANIFASNFLLPTKAFTTDIEKKVTDLDYYLLLKKTWNVSAASMVYRTRSLNLLSADDYVRLQKRMSSRGWRKKEPFDTVHAVSRPVMLKQAFQLLVDADIIGQTTIMDLLEKKYQFSIPVDIISELLGVPVQSLSSGRIVSLK